MKAAWAIRFPLFDTLVDPHKAISLEKKRIAEWVNTALLEIVEIYQRDDRNISVMSANGIKLSFLQIPHSPGPNEFNVNANQTKWDNKLISMLAGDKMSTTESLQCLWSRLDKQNKKNVRGEIKM
jgi:hypothetical protein